MRLHFFLPVCPKTKKNSQQILNNSRTGKPFISQSAGYKQFSKDCSLLIPKEHRLMLDVPCNVKTVFFMPDRRRVDLSNLIAAIHDVLVDCHVLADDNCKVVASVDGSCVKVEKGKVGIDVEIEVID